MTISQDNYRVTRTWIEINKEKWPQELCACVGEKGKKRESLESIDFSLDGVVREVFLGEVTLVPKS